MEKTVDQVARESLSEVSDCLFEVEIHIQQNGISLAMLALITNLCGEARELAQYAIDEASDGRDHEKHNSLH